VDLDYFQRVRDAWRSKRKNSMDFKLMCLLSAFVTHLQLGREAVSRWMGVCFHPPQHPDCILTPYTSAIATTRGRAGNAQPGKEET